jgi:hypothetical protein
MSTSSGFDVSGFDAAFVFPSVEQTFAESGGVDVNGDVSKSGGGDPEQEDPFKPFDVSLLS